MTKKHKIRVNDPNIYKHSSLLHYIVNKKGFVTLGLCWWFAVTNNFEQSTLVFINEKINKFMIFAFWWSAKKSFLTMSRFLIYLIFANFTV